ncbi:FecCD family ABC transporter permease [Nocardia arthritidis]|uniref:Iron chelate uptake ABC transporter family permease subunit n=1 Tax=Nocardia arthritidis TaxID=228602 RepID=A0A6G9YLY2_9NOCA|nr:iron ABC transporter permease [Nocardia arthritidis]QIS14077.1 iron chelate uptake ABC transporter family permease subunit [Nocardia arthritidis]
MSRMPYRTVAVLTALVACLGVAVLLSLLIGARAIDPAAALEALVRGDGSREGLVIRDIRLPRTALGVLAGAGLAVAGALLQGLTRNPLAEPGVLGVSSGAAFAVVLAIYVAGVGTPLGTAGSALLGAGVASAVVYAGYAGRGAVTPIRLALIGAALSVMLSSWSYTLMSLDKRTADEARFWLTGSLAGRPMTVSLAVAPFIVAGLVLAIALARPLNLLALGDDAATALGARPVPVRVIGGIAVALLAGGAVAGAGPIAFVGLAVPHLMRLLLGRDHRILLAGCALAGPVLLLGADIVGRILLRPMEIEAGIVTALMGAPVLIGLAIRARAGRTA